jgi:diguanylate cyclase (GGDEF)-like protein/PAS domain S-box-containing protein
MIKGEIMKEKEADFKHLTEKISEIVAILDFYGNFKWLGKYHEVLGYEAKELLGKNALRLIHPQDLPQIKSEFERLVCGEIEKTRVVFRYRKGDNSYIWLETIAQVISGDKEKGIFLTSRDITSYYEEGQALKLILKYYNDFIQYNIKEINYKKITDDFARIVNSLAVALNIYKDDGRTFVTKAISVKAEILTKAVKILGFTLEGKEWKHDKIRAEKIKKHITTIFPKLEDLTGDVIPKCIIKTLQNMFSIGEVAVVKIMEGERMFGDFTIIMPKGTKFGNKTVAEIFANQLGLLLERQQKEKERVKIERALRESENKYRNIFNHSPVGIFHFNNKGIVTDCNSAFIKILGSIKEKILGTDIFSLDNVGVVEGIKKALKGKNAYYEGLYTSRTSGKTIYVFSKFAPIFTDDGEITGGMGIVEDMTDRKKMEDMLHFEKEYLRTTLLGIGEGVISTDKWGYINLFNPGAEKITGWKKEEALGKKFYEIIKVIAREEHGVKIERKDKKIIYIEKNKSPIKDQKGEVIGEITVFRDCTEKIERQKKIEFLSYYDELTELYNRRYIVEQLKRLDKGENLPLGIVIVDINGLKITNDAFGHDTGDRLIKLVANILTECCPPQSIIGRMGGDEFIILLPNTNETIVEEIIEKIKGKGAKSKLESVVVSFAVGYAIKKEIAENLGEIYKLADHNMYKDKLKRGKSIGGEIVENVLKTINSQYLQEQIHSERVSQYCEAIGKALNLTEKEIGILKGAGALHDIGKITVSPEILNKSSKLTPEEYEEVKRHPEIGYQILRSVDEYRLMAEFVLSHHERWDGKGYPRGLKGEEIPLEGRII